MASVMDSQQIAALNERYAIPGQLAVKAGPGGLAVVEVDNGSGRATLALQGAHLLDWTPRNAAGVIWLSPDATFAPGRSIRGGIPVCWPWFGNRDDQPSLPAHGFARTAAWTLVETAPPSDGLTRLVLRLQQNASTRRLWPHEAQLELHLGVGERLEMELVTTNRGSTVIGLGEALHTYFRVADVRDIRIGGLEGCHYLDKVAGGRDGVQAGPVRFDTEVDRIYVDHTGPCYIDDPGLRRRIHVDKQGSRSTVVWNPWIEKSRRLGDMGEDGYLRMVCVESANAAANLVAVGPGEEHRLRVAYRIEPLP